MSYTNYSSCHISCIVESSAAGVRVQEAVLTKLVRAFTLFASHALERRQPMPLRAFDNTMSHSSSMRSLPVRSRATVSARRCDSGAQLVKQLDADNGAAGAATTLLATFRAQCCARGRWCQAGHIAEASWIRKRFHRACSAGVFPLPQRQSCTHAAAALARTVLQAPRRHSSRGPYYQPRS
jgi:hypothetical protein